MDSLWLKLRRVGVPALYGAFALQTVSALFFVGELWSEVLGLRTWPTPWAWQETIQILASAGLLVGVVVSGVFIKRSLGRLDHLGRQIDVLMGNYHHHLIEQFAAWGLSPSEEAVAIYAIKGFSNAEIADLRNTSIATVKSQMNSIFRKAGLSSRQQLISFLVEEFIGGSSTRPPSAPPPARLSMDA